MKEFFNDDKNLVILAVLILGLFVLWTPPADKDSISLLASILSGFLALPWAGPLKITIQQSKRRTRMRKINCFPVLCLLILSLFLMGCAGLNPPDNFTQTQKIEYTTLKTLKSAKIFREFALESAGSVYKKGLMKEDTKDKIIRLGDDLQLAINTAADALLAYKKSGGLGGNQALEEKLIVYQSLFNQFMEMVAPYVAGTSGKEVS